jgi:hypothetical protein
MVGQCMRELKVNMNTEGEHEIGKKVNLNKLFIANTYSDNENVE